MSKSAFYAVHRGRRPGIYETWTECAQQVNGYPHACFRGFNDYDEAVAFWKTGPANAAPVHDSVVIRQGGRTAELPLRGKLAGALRSLGLIPLP